MRHVCVAVQDTAHLTQDYTSSPLHRFRQAGSKNAKVSLLAAFCR